MSNKSRQGIRPAFLAAVLGVAAMLAVVTVLMLPSGLAHAQANPFVPGAPTDVGATANSDGTQVMVTWTAATSGARASGYEVERKVGSGDWMSAAPAHGDTTTSYADSNVSDGMTYTYRVRATNDFGQSVWVESDPVTVTVPVPENEPPTVSTPVMDPVTITGLMKKNADGEDVNNTKTVEGVTAYFSDPEGDDLRFTAGSSNTAVATAVIEDGNLVITAQGAGNATITVTATDEDGSGMSATSTIEVTVRLSPQERYDVSILDDEDVPPVYIVDPDNVATITATTYPIEVEDVKFEVSALDQTGAPLGASDEDVTLTVEVMPNDQAEVLDSLGLDSSGLNIGETLQGLITIRGVDAGRRIFSLDVKCLAVGGKIEVDILDDQLNLVAEAMILCAEPVVIVPDDDEFRSDIMTVVSYNDWDHWADYETVSDGFIIDDTDDNVRHIVNEGDGKVYDQMGVLVRDEPVVDDYQLAISEKEMLTLKAGEDPDRLTKAEAEAGQHTIEVMVGAEYVQLTVTSTMEGPAYIRFLRSNMMPFSTDVDEGEMWRGASVVGLDEGRLALNMMPNLTKAQALAYDQYRVIIPGAADGYAYLYGLAGDYHQGTFRFFNPCPSELGEDHHFYVEVYESEGKYLKTREMIDCATSPRPGPTGLEFTIDSQEVGEGELTYRHARNADEHTVLLVDAHSRTIVASISDAPETVRFSAALDRELNDGWRYHFIVVAHGVNDQYTADAVTAEVNWINNTDAAPSTLTAGAPTRSHIVCQTGNDAVMELLADCDVNTAPMAPSATLAAQTVTAGMTAMVQSTITDADMGDMLTWSAMSSMPSYATATVDNMGMVTIMGVAAGSATITVTATDMHGETAMQTIMVTVTAAMLGAPTGVMATVDDSDPGSTNVTVSWTNGMNADGHEVGLVDLSDYSVRDHRVTDGATSHTFTNVASGRYMAIVVSTMDADFEYDVEIVTVP